MLDSLFHFFEVLNFGLIMKGVVPELIIFVQNTSDGSIEPH